MVARRKSAPAASVQQISPCLWFDGQAEEAARFYVSVFRKGKIGTITRTPKVGQEIHGRPAGSVLTVEFVLNGLPFLGLNGGPNFKFNEAVSLMVLCDTQAEIDYYWDKLSAGGVRVAQGQVRRLVASGAQAADEDVEGPQVVRNRARVRRDAGHEEAGHREAESRLQGEVRARIRP